MAKLYRPSVEELEQLRNEATKNGAVTEAAWVADFARIHAGFLRSDPCRYRAYGPYWWSVKKAFLDQGITEFGDTIDKEWLEQTDYGNQFHNLLAAWVYNEGALDGGLIYSHGHTIAFEPEEEGMERDVQAYTIVDEDVEFYAKKRGLSRP